MGGLPPSSGVVPIDLEIDISRSDLGVVFARSDFGEWVDAVPADSDRCSILFLCVINSLSCMKENESKRKIRKHRNNANTEIHILLVCHTF